MKLLGKKDNSISYDLVQNSDKNDKRWNFSYFQKLGVQDYPKTGQLWVKL